MIENEVWAKKTSKGIVTIRPAGEKDLKGILRLYAQIFEEERAEQIALKYRKEIHKPGFFVAMIGENVIGYTDIWYFTAVDKDFRRLGIAEGLVILTAKYVKDNEVTSFLPGATDPLLKIVVKLEKLGLVELIQETMEDWRVRVLKDKRELSEKVYMLLRELGWRKVDD